MSTTPQDPAQAGQALQADQPAAPRRPTDPETLTREWQQLLAQMDGAVLPCNGGRNVEWTSDNPTEQKRAAYWCQPCTVKEACLAYAMATKESHGVYGGKTSAERKTMRREREHQRIREDRKAQRIHGTQKSAA